MASVSQTKGWRARDVDWLANYRGSVPVLNVQVVFLVLDLRLHRAVIVKPSEATCPLLRPNTEGPI